MDLTNIQTIKNILRHHNLWANKKLGQNFLVSNEVLEKIVKSADLKKDDVVLEIGPGIGTLTQVLLLKVKKVIAVEKDPKMFEILSEKFKGFKNLKIILGDILKINLTKELPKNYKIVANIPYYITSPLLKLFLESKNKPREIILMVQKEVAERICAECGKLSILAISVQFFATSKIISNVNKENFWPKPKVDSAIIKISPRVTPSAGNINEKEFFKLVKIGFSSPRKKLLNNLSAGFNISKEKVGELLKKAEINQQIRAEDLSLDDWYNLYNILREETNE